MKEEMWLNLDFWNSPQNLDIKEDPVWDLRFQYELTNHPLPRF
jgi:hypothetical protein